jgi:pimeloyl-ACP methyl ester carboxylesterase
VLDSLKVKQAYIFGNSLGGPIAVRMYMLKPEKVAALILCAKHPPVEASSSASLILRVPLTLFVG